MKIVEHPENCSDSETTPGSSWVILGLPWTQFRPRSTDQTETQRLAHRGPALQENRNATEIRCVSDSNHEEMKVRSVLTFGLNHQNYHELSLAVDTLKIRCEMDKESVK